MPRQFSHLTPRYVKDRLLVMTEEVRNPGNPWLTRDAVKFLAEALRAQDAGMEFGSGRSTLWFAQRLKTLISIEGNEFWHAKVQAMIRDAGLGSRVDHRKCVRQEDYVAQAASVADDSLDFCLVDGEFRDECAIAILPKLRSGALLVVDNVNWYLPHATTASPASRRPADGCQTPLWTRFAAVVEGWRRYWTSNGVTDTAIWIKP